MTHLRDDHIRYPTKAASVVILNMTGEDSPQIMANTNFATIDTFKMTIVGVHHAGLINLTTKL